MKATFLEPLGETPEPSASCTNCPAVLRLERALEQLQRDFRREVGYWKSQHAKAVKRIKQLEEELDQSRGQVHALQDKLFGRKSEKSAQGNRSNDLFDPQEVGTTPKNAVRSTVMPVTVDATIPTCPSWKSSSGYRKNRWPVRSAASRPR